MTATTVGLPLRPRRVRPYPLDELPRLLRVQVELGRLLWRHLWALLDASAVGTARGRSEVEGLLGGPLSVTAQEPYLAPVDRLPGLLRGARLVELTLISPPQPRAILALDESLCQKIGLRSDERVQDLLRRLLHGAPVRVSTASSEEAKGLLGDAVTRSLLVLDFKLEVGSQAPEVGWARLLTGAQLRLSAPPPASLAALRRIGERRHRLDGVQSSLSIEAGYGFLPAREVLNLRPGDIVVLDHFGPKPVTGGPVWLRLAGGVFPAHLDGSGVTVLGSFHLRAQAMAEHSPDEAAAPDAAPPANESLLRELPVQITCEIGRITLSAREVLDLRPGAVLPVGRPLAGPVDLTAGGRLIGRGELVDVEGEIGVRVTEIVD